MAAAYSTVAALVARYGEEELVQLTSSMEDPTVMVEARAQAALEAASAELDAYIGVRRPCPVDPIPAILQELAEDVAIYKLTTLRSRGGTEDARKRYEDAMKLVRDYAKGLASLGFIEPVQDDREVPGMAAFMGGRERLFTRDMDL